MMWELMNEMGLCDRSEHIDNRNPPRDIDHSIFREWESSILINLKKKAWFTCNEIDELKNILKKFPDNHVKIR